MQKMTANICMSNENDR